MIENAGLVEKLEAHAGFMENGGICEHSMTDEPGLLREAAQRIRELEVALVAETERCAKVADDAAAEMVRIAKLHPGNSIPRDTCFSRGREAQAIAAAIRAGAPR